MSIDVHREADDLALLEPEKRPDRDQQTGSGRDGLQQDGREDEQALEQASQAKPSGQEHAARGERNHVGHEEQRQHVERAPGADVPTQFGQGEGGEGEDDLEDVAHASRSSSTGPVSASVP